MEIIFKLILIVIYTFSGNTYLTGFRQIFCINDNYAPFCFLSFFLGEFRTP